MMAVKDTETQQGRPEPQPPRAYFVGMVTRPCTDWANLVCEPQPDKTAVKEETRQRQVEKKRQEQAENSGRMPVTATVAEAAIIDIRGECVAHFLEPDSAQPGYVSSQLIQALTANVNRLLGGDAPTVYNDTQVRLFGFGISLDLRIACLDAMAGNCLLEPADRLEIPVGLWYHRMFHAGTAIDPYEALVPARYQSDIGIVGLCRRLGLVVPEDLGQNALARAELARQLTLRAQLVPTDNPQLLRWR